MRNVVTMMALAMLLGFLSFAYAADEDVPAEFKEDFAIQGEYTGVLDVDGQEQKWGIQVIALGDGKFQAVGYEGGLPGDGWNGRNKRIAEGAMRDGTATLQEAEVTLNISGGKLVVIGPWADELGTLKKVGRKSTTLGMKPPQGASLLFDGTTADHFKDGRMSEDGLLMEGCTSKQKFGNSKCHIEFRTPFMPKDRGQGRGNSGCYYQGRYEIQILDSFGLEGKDNECGGIYTVAAPKVNMCYPPLAWQTYDIDLTAAVFEDGKKVKNARITIRHNGIVIHKDLELPDVTPGNVIPEGPEPGPIFLQDHGNPVRFRNIWVAEE
ncbi:MAG: DUF1080 domain-containing protein [Pirellulales bacterium]|nr:DUF1080 domain-containing protein [Pirellulales bacterium]